MSGYGVFAAFYDRLMEDADYPGLAAHYWELFRRHRGRPPGTVLDLACGSGALLLPLAALGADVIGVDGSPDMLAIARDKAAAAGLSPLLLHQDMRQLDLYGTVEGAVCAMDSINHLCRTQEVAEVFRRLYWFIEPGGLLLFDANTPYKHREVLGSNAFVFEEEGFLCIWRNHLREKTCTVEMQLDFFVDNGEGYRRVTDCLAERAYAPRTLVRLLDGAGFETLAVYGDRTGAPPADKEERLFFVAQRRED